MPSLTVRLPEDLHSWLQDQAKASGLNLTDTLLEILKNAKDGKLLKTPSQGNRYQVLDQDCEFLKWLEADAEEKEGFYCVRTDGAKRRLSDIEEKMSKICEGCNARRQIREVLTALQQGGTATYYTCQVGGQISKLDPNQVECPTDSMHRWTKFSDCKEKKCPYIEEHQIQLKQIGKTTSKKQRR